MVSMVSHQLYLVHVGIHSLPCFVFVPFSMGQNTLLYANLDGAFDKIKQNRYISFESITKCQRTMFCDFALENS